MFPNCLIISFNQTMKATMASHYCLLMICLLVMTNEGLCESTVIHDQSIDSWSCCGPSCTKNVYLSVVIPDQEPECALRVRDVPLYADLYETMLFAEQQYPPSKFNFSVTFYDKYGHFITGINGAINADPFFWCVYNRRGVPLPVGVDFTYPSNRDAYIWSFENTTETHCTEYAGPCSRFNDDEVLKENSKQDFGST